jgi:hypothetical protein
MIHYMLRNCQEAEGGFTDLWVIGTTRAYSASTKTWGTDFTAAAVTQVYDLVQTTTSTGLPIYIVHYPLVMVAVKTGTLPGTTDIKADIGIAASQTGATTFLAGTAADMETAGNFYVPVTAAAPASGQGSNSQFLTCRLTSASGNISTLTAGEIWIYAALSPVSEWLTNRQA